MDLKEVEIHEDPTTDERSWWTPVGQAVYPKLIAIYKASRKMMLEEVERYGENKSQDIGYSNGTTHSVSKWEGQAMEAPLAVSRGGTTVSIQSLPETAPGTWENGNSQVIVFYLIKGVISSIS